MHSLGDGYDFHAYVHLFWSETVPECNFPQSRLFLQNENPAACQLAQALLKREVEVLRNPLQQFLLSAMLKGKSDSDLKKDYHDVIYEVYRSAPQLLLNVLPNLEAELQVSLQDDCRRKLFPKNIPNAKARCMDSFAYMESTVN